MPEFDPDATVPPTDADQDLDADDLDPPDEDTSLNNEGDDDGDGTPGKEQKAVPYKRFDQVNKRLKDLEPWQEAVDQLKRDFQTPAQMKAALAAERERQQKAQQDQADQAEQDRLLELYNRKIADGEMDEDQARAAIQKDWVELNASKREKALSAELEAERKKAKDVNDRLTAIESERLLDRLRGDDAYSDMDEEWVLAKYKADGGDLRAIAKASHKREAAKAEKRLADYNAGKGSGSGRKAPGFEKSGGAAPSSNKSPDTMTDAEFQKWWTDSKATGRKNATGNTISL